MRYFGTRRIRSAGRTSGSIEVTLPAQLQGLEEVQCRLIVRDGLRPEIVLQPDLSAAQTLFADLWQKLRLGLSDVDEIGDFDPANFTLALFPPPHWQERPPLSYIDGFTVLHQRVQQEQRAEVLARLIAFMSVAAGYRLDLSRSLALAFGDAVAYLITGNLVGLGTDFERGLAHDIFWGNSAVPQSLGSPLDDQVWQRAKPGLQRVYAQFHMWQADPEGYTAAREKWYKALTVEMSGQAMTLEKYIQTHS